MKNTECFTNLRVIFAQGPCYSSLYSSNFIKCNANVTQHFFQNCFVYKGGLAWDQKDSWWNLKQA